MEVGLGSVVEGETEEKWVICNLGSNCFCGRYVSMKAVVLHA